MNLKVLICVTSICASATLADYGVEDAMAEMMQSMIDKSLQSFAKQFELCYMGMKSGLIPNYAVRASTYWDDRHAPHLSRLDNQISHKSTGSWSSKQNSVGTWIEIDFFTVKKVAGVITQGRPKTHNQWVTKYKVACSTDGTTYQMVREGSSDKIYTGNFDFDTKVYNRFPAALSCRYIRIYPHGWHNHISMRLEFVHGHCFNIKPF